MDNQIQWHASFFAALQLELMEYQECFDFINEYPLNGFPQKIDVIVTKKLQNVVIEKNIAKIFKKYNIIEYRSPVEALDTYDFYLVYSYMMQYVALDKVDINDLTMTLVCERFPRKLFFHLKNDRRFNVDFEDGICYVSGDYFPIQIIVRGQLNESENAYLNILTRFINPKSVINVIKKLAKNKTGDLPATFFDAVFKANPGVMKEVFKMSKALSKVEMEELQAAADTFIVQTGLDKVWEKKWYEKYCAEKELLIKEISELKKRLGE